MAIHIQAGKNDILLGGSARDSKVQRLPFKVYADCDAKVTEYFESTVKSNGDDTSFQASFRGLPLKGTKVALPLGYVGIVMHESIAPTCEKEERKFHIINKFGSVTYWNWGKAPSKNDKFIQALEWIHIAEALHTPILEE